MKPKPIVRRFMAISLIIAASLFAGAGSAVLGVCGPFTDVSDAAFCPFVLEIFYLGITTGTSPTTYDPAGSVNRLQMAAFLSRSVDGVLKRGGRRAALEQFWTTAGSGNLGLTTIADSPVRAKSDGVDLWVASNFSNTVSRVRAGDAKHLETWTATGARALVVAMGRIFVTGYVSPGRLYSIDPSQPAGAATTVASNLGNNPDGIAFDGSKVWTTGDSVSIVTPGATIPWTVTTVTAGFIGPLGMIHDGGNVWITDGPTRLLKLDANGAILQTVTVGFGAAHPVFDGTNIWVPGSSSASVTVVRASTGAVLATLTGNGLDGPSGGAFDGQRVMLVSSSTETLSLWKAADLTPIGSFSASGLGPRIPCSDGINFWIPLFGPDQLARF